MFGRIRNLFKGKKESNSPQVTREIPILPKIICSECNRLLQPVGNMFDAFSGGVTTGSNSAEGFQQWLGWVCTSCDLIFCADCVMKRRRSSFASQKCPNCRNQLEAAIAMNLKKMGKL